MTNNSTNLDKAQKTANYATLASSQNLACQRPRVAGYDVLEELGRGGMGVVYRACQVGLDRIVALKILVSGSHAGQPERDRFTAEALAVAAVQHPNVVQIHDVGQHEGLPYMALEYVAGGSLHERLKQGLPPPREAAWLTEQLALGVQAAHDRAIVHRDLKPHNVLLAAPAGANQGPLPLTHCVPKVTDFGLAKKVEGDGGVTVSGAVLGTPSYMAPEQARGDAKRVGPAADVYALGAILYECLTGRPPFHGPSAWETIARVVDAEPLPIRHLQPSVSRDLETICMKCLQKDPLRRYASAWVLAEDLHRFQAGEPVQARPVGQLERSWRWCRRNRGVASLGAALLLVLLATAVGGAVAAVRFYRLAASEEQAKNKALDLAQSEAEARESTRQARDQAVAKGKELRRHLSLQYVANGARALNESNHGLALLWYVNALALDQGDPEREPAHRLRVANTWRQMPRLVGVYRHEAPVTWAEMSPDGKQVVTASYDGTARLWDVGSGRQVGQTMKHDGFFVLCARFSPDGRTIATGGGHCYLHK